MPRRPISLSLSLSLPETRAPVVPESCTKSRAFSSRACPKKSHRDPKQAAEQQESTGRAERGGEGARTLTGLKLFFFFFCSTRGREQSRAEQSSKGTEKQNKMHLIQEAFPRPLSRVKRRTCGGSEGPPSASNGSARRRARGDGAAGKGHLGEAGRGREEEKGKEKPERELVSSEKLILWGSRKAGGGEERKKLLLALLCSQKKKIKTKTNL